ncbi:MAG: PEP-CTERM sorting domain-containing protein [Pirellulales bacterium]|nr:PEP-CTERM sorting domain-containing protein [Planctomycetales bacterium]
MTRTRGNNTLAIIAALTVVTALAASTQALAGPLATTGDALSPGGPDSGYWRGSHQLVGGTFAGTVDFAVFAPGDFQSYLDTTYGGGAYADPTGGAEYIYAFQFSSDSGSTIQRLNAGYDLGADIGSLAAPGYFAGSGDTSPVSTAYNSTSAVWSWGFGASVANGQTSDLLFYSSNWAPKPDFTTLGAQYLLDQADSGPNDYASPAIPEPTSLFSLIIALVGFAAATSRRRG